MIIYNNFQIKVSRCSKRTKSSQTLILNDLNQSESVSQVKNTIQIIIDKFNLIGFKIKLIESDPVEFKLISSSADDYYQFIIQFPDELKHIQTSIHV